MRVILSGGGTAGHVNPALAIAERIKEKWPNSEFLYIGGKGMIEQRLAEKNAMQFEEITVDGFSRKMNFGGIRRNLGSFRKFLSAERKSREIIREFKPDLVIGTGGFVCAPVLSAAAKLRIPTVLHESNAYPGITTKFLQKKVDRILLSMGDAKQRLKYPEKCIVTGNPIRAEYYEYPRQEARTHYDVGDKLCILSFGGSLGATKLNEAVAGLIGDDVLGEKPIVHIHATGKNGKAEFYELLQNNGIDWETQKNLYLRDYIDDMPRALAAADLVICRAGSQTLSELTAAGKPAVLIPSPNVTENHQYYNALVLKKAGGAEVIEERDLSADSLIDMVTKMTEGDKLISYREGQLSLAVYDAADRILNEIEALSGIKT